LQSKKVRGTWITEIIMGSINSAIKKQEESKSSWKKEEGKVADTAVKTLFYP
jgi:hypothetical protein